MRFDNIAHVNSGAHVLPPIGPLQRASALVRAQVRTTLLILLVWDR